MRCLKMKYLFRMVGDCQTKTQSDYVTKHGAAEKGRNMQHSFWKKGNCSEETKRGRSKGVIINGNTRNVPKPVVKRRTHYMTNANLVMMGQPIDLFYSPWMQTKLFQEPRTPLQTRSGTQVLPVGITVPTT